MSKEYDPTEFKKKKNSLSQRIGFNIGIIIGGIFLYGIMAFLLLLLFVGVRWGIQTLFG
jgi:hypothetical protein